MRAFVFLLILLYLLFLAWTRGLLGGEPAPDALRPQQQLQADRIKIVARDTLPNKEAPLPEAPPKAEPPVEEEKPTVAPEQAEKMSCVQFTELASGEAAQVEHLLQEKFPAFKGHKAGGFWVFVPPLPSKQEAERKAAELKKFQVPEFYIVQDAGPQRFSISLGVFSTREAAEDRLQQLRNKGVRSAEIGERELKSLNSSSLEVRGPENQSDALRRAVSTLLPKSRANGCPQKSNE